MILTAEQRALKTIVKGTTAWEKTKTKLEGAIEVLMSIVSKKSTKIAKLQLENDLL
jgi:DNA-binding transcriptional regulator YiaG